MENNKSFAILAGVAFSIILALLIIPAQSEDTIFFIQKDGSTPEPCTGNVGLVLAQNLTDLCDVTIISPTTNQIIKYNGSQWVNVAQATFNDTTTCNNIGVGNAFVCVEGTNVDLRSLLAGTAISISNDTNTITITNTLPEATTASNLGLNGSPIFSSEVGNDLQFRKLAPGTDIGMGFNSTHVIITNDNPEATLCINLNDSDNAGLCVNDTIELKSLLEGSSISLTSNGTNVIITNTAPDNTVCANVGTGTVIYKDGECNFKTLIGSPDISITNTTNTVVIDYNGTHVTQVTSNDNTTLGVIPTTGNIVLYPTLKKLCEFTGVGGETAISCSLSANVQSLYFQVHWNSSASSTTWALRFNNDSSSIYGSRSSTNGGADATVGSQAFLASQTSTANQINSYFMECHDHSSTMLKYCVGERMNIASGANAPGRVELYSTWRNVTDRITSIDMVRTAGAGTLIAGSHIIVWGYS